MARRTYYPAFYRRTVDYRNWVAKHRDLMEAAVGITAGSAQDAELTTLLNALNAISPANGWPAYTEGP
jgi:hypothetical protein